MKLTGSILSVLGYLCVLRSGYAYILPSSAALLQPARTSQMIFNPRYPAVTRPFRQSALQASTENPNINTGRNCRLPVEGGDICYDYLPYNDKSDVTGPPIVYLPGLIREKNEAKSINLQSLCKRADLSFLSADYFGVGRSSGQFQDGSLSRWTADTIRLIDTVLGKTAGRCILVGHGVGAWVAFLIALQRPDLAGGIVGLSADPDFTEELLWKTLPEDVKKNIMEDGIYEITWGKEKYPITRKLIEDGRSNLILQGEPDGLAVRCPVRLIHALEDEEVPVSLALQLARRLASRDSSLQLLKDASHAMEGEREFECMRAAIKEVVEAFGDGVFDLTSPGSG